MRILRALPVAALLLVVAGCGDDGTTPLTPVDGGLDGTTYVVTAVTDAGKPRPLVDGTEIRLRFDDAQLSITAGCNSMSGRYAFSDGTLSVESLATTEMGCDPARMDQDTWVAGLFAGPVELRTGADTRLTSGDVVLALADREQVSPDQPLTGTTWLLDSIGAGGPDGAVSSVPAGVVAHLTVEGDSASVYDGCNEGSGPVQVDAVQVGEGRIDFGDRVQTLRGCVDDRQIVANAIAEVLAGETTFVIEEKSLRITRGDSSLGFRAVDELPDHD
jgi:heat shock protein HslJ